MTLSLRLMALATALAVGIATYLLGPIVLAVVAIALLTYLYVPLDRARWVPVFVFVAALTASAFLFHVAAFAADGAPETVVQATSETNKVVWAWGATLSELAGALASALFGLALIALRKLPANVIAIFGNARAETLLKNAIDYGVNAVAGAVKDKKLEVDVGNKVLREALQYAVDNAPAWLLSWVGGPEQLAKKIWARLELHENADASALPGIVDSVKPSA